VIERIHWLRTVTVEVKAGTAVRRYSAVKATGPDDIVFASVAKGVPMRDNNVLSRFIKPAARKLGMGWETGKYRFVCRINCSRFRGNAAAAATH
jgi:hypothetical protein